MAGSYSQLDPVALPWRHYSSSSAWSRRPYGQERWESRTPENSLAARCCTPSSSLPVFEEAGGPERWWAAPRLRHLHLWQEDGNWAACQINPGCDKPLSAASARPCCRAIAQTLHWPRSSFLGSTSRGRWSYRSTEEVSGSKTASSDWEKWEVQIWGGHFFSYLAQF